MGWCGREIMKDTKVGDDGQLVLSLVKSSLAYQECDLQPVALLAHWEEVHLATLGSVAA
jgi:hypothetical protein